MYQLRNIDVLAGGTVDGTPILQRTIISELSDVYEQFGFSTEEARQVNIYIVFAEYCHRFAFDYSQY